MKRVKEAEARAHEAEAEALRRLETLRENEASSEEATRRAEAAERRAEVRIIQYAFMS